MRATKQKIAARATGARPVLLLHSLVRREVVAEGLAMSRESGVAAALRTATETAIVLRAIEQARETYM